MINLREMEYSAVFYGIDFAQYDSKGRLWFSDSKDMYCLSKEKLYKFELNEYFYDLQFVEDKQGNIWLAGLSMGIYCISVPN